jgi:hypothetical protein
LNFKILTNNNNVIREKVMTLVLGEQEPGTHYIEFLSKDMLPGVYLYRLDTPLGTEVKRMIVYK